MVQTSLVKMIFRHEKVKNFELVWIKDKQLLQIDGLGFCLRQAQSTIYFINIKTIGV